jgi:hypothetical protein
MRAYVDQVEREGAPWSNPEMLEPWREGTVVDLTTD